MNSPNTGAMPGELLREVIDQRAGLTFVSTENDAPRDQKRERNRRYDPLAGGASGFFRTSSIDLKSASPNGSRARITPFLSSRYQVG